MTSDRGLAIVLVDKPGPVGFDALSSALTALGSTVDQGDSEGSLRIDGTIDVAISSNVGPHPDAHKMPRSLTSIKPDVLARTEGFHVIAAFGLDPSDQLAADLQLSRITAAVVRATPAIGAMLLHGKFFYEADFFARMVENDPTRVASQITVDLTVAPQPGGQMEVLTHGLARYGHYEFLALTPDGAGVLYAMGLAKDVVERAVQLSPDQAVAYVDGRPVQPVVTPSPLAGQPPILRIDPSAPQPKKRRFGRTR